MREDFKYLDHVADAEFIAYGETPEEAFVNAARATFKLLVDPALVIERLARDVEVTAPDMEGLLHDWLDELLFMNEVDRLVFSRFEASIGKIGQDYVLNGRAFGENMDPARHIIDTCIKAVTYHGLRFEKAGNIYEAQVLLDI
jgi:SHS2 domain-containing protein